MLQQILFKEFVPGYLPRKGNPDDAGFDLRVFRVLPADAPLSEDYPEGTQSTFYVEPGATVKLDCACKVALPSDVLGLVVPRSSWRKEGLLILSVFDPGFLLPWAPFATNCSSKTLEIKKGERVAQVLFIPIESASYLNVTRFPEFIYDRGGGCGSTGTV